MQNADKSNIKRRGFGSMSKERMREIASKGGKAAHAQGTAHKFNSETGAAAGRIGGLAVSKDKLFMSEIGSKGGNASHLVRQQKRRVTS